MSDQLELEWRGRARGLALWRLEAVERVTALLEAEPELELKLMGWPPLVQERSRMPRSWRAALLSLVQSGDILVFGESRFREEPVGEPDILEDPSDFFAIKGDSTRGRFRLAVRDGKKLLRVPAFEFLRADQTLFMFEYEHDTFNAGDDRQLVGGRLPPLVP